MTLVRAVLMPLSLSASLCLSALCLSTLAFAAKPSGAGDPHHQTEIDAAPPLVAVYVSIKQPKATFVLASTRKTGVGYRQRLLHLAKEARIEVVLPVVSDILNEAMTAVRIAVHDSAGLRGIAAMQGAKTVLAGRLEMREDQSWSVTWSISTAIGKRRWRVENVSFDSAITGGLAATAQVLSGDLAVERYPLPKLMPMLSEDVELREERARNRELEHLPLPENLPE